MEDPVVTELRTAVIVDAVRTPSAKGKPGGALSGVHPVDLLAGTLEALLTRTGLDPALVEDVIVGCAQQVGEQSGNIARHAVLAAGLPEAVPATTINRQCGSSQQAATFAAQGVMAGGYDVVLAAGVESMSVVPLGSSRPASLGRRNAERYPDGLVHQGISAELVAARWKLDREELDAYSAESHRRAAVTAAAGGFAGEIVPVSTGAGPVAADETVRPATTAAALAGLRPSFRTEEMAARFPEIGWTITPGNSSPLTDGASAVLIMSEDAARRLGLRPRARFASFAVVGDDPLMMLTGPIPATRKVLARSGLSLEDIDTYEVNEAFAPVPLAWAAEFGADLGRLNPRGGAIALGHALGSSGTRLLVTLLNHLEQTGGHYGLQTMCEAGGMANAMIIERL
jgi:acetyl-CoA acyltransferase